MTQLATITLDLEAKPTSEIQFIFESAEGDWSNAFDSGVQVTPVMGGTGGRVRLRNEPFWSGVIAGAEGQYYCVARTENCGLRGRIINCVQPGLVVPSSNYELDEAHGWMGRGIELTLGGSFRAIYSIDVIGGGVFTEWRIL